MADFCRQCAEDMWGDANMTDLADLSTEADTANRMYPVVICEGCGVIQVDHTGLCVSEDCLLSHGKSE